MVAPEVVSVSTQTNRIADLKPLICLKPVTQTSSSQTANTVSYKENEKKSEKPSPQTPKVSTKQTLSTSNRFQAFESMEVDNNNPSGVRIKRGGPLGRPPETNK